LSNSTKILKLNSENISYEFINSILNLLSNLLGEVPTLTSSLHKEEIVPIL
jgi:hypothetical protein